MDAKICRVLIVLFFILSSNSKAYLIEGEIKGVKSGFNKTVYLSRISDITHFESTSPEQIIDSTHLHQDGSFRIKGDSLLNKNSIFKTLSRGHNINWRNQKKVVCRIYLVPKGKPTSFITGQKKYSIYLVLKENSKVKILANIEKIGDYELVNGGYGSKELRELRQDIASPIYDKAYEIQKKLLKVKKNPNVNKDSILQLKKLFRLDLVSLYSKIRSDVKDFILKTKSYCAQLYASSVHYNYDDNINNDIRFFKELKTKLNKEYPNCLYIKQFTKRITNATNLLERSKAPGFNNEEFQLINERGIRRDLTDWKGNIILLDFWASWCKPCRRAFRTKLKPLYEQYSNKDFKIISIALQKDPKRWQKALNEEKLPWVKLFALKYPNDQISVKYNVNKLPHYSVIGKDGSLIMPGMPFPQIRKKLKTRFKDSIQKELFLPINPLEQDTFTLKIQSGYSKKKIVAIENYFKYYGFKIEFNGEYDKEKGLEQLEGYLKYKDNNVKFASSGRMEKIIIRLDNTMNTTSITVKTFSKPLLNIGG